MAMPGRARPVLPGVIAAVLCLVTPLVFASPAATLAGQGAGERQFAVAAAVESAVASVGARLPAAPARDLTMLYELARRRPLWLDASGNPGQAAREAVAMLSDAGGDGLDPADYATVELSAALAALPMATPASAAAFDVGLSAGILQFYRHLHLGRVDPQRLGLGLVGPRDTHDFAALLFASVARGRVAQVAADLRPPYPQYGLLRTALSRYRALAAAPAEPVAFTSTVHPGDPLASLPALRDMLLAQGDVPATAPPAGNRYEGVLVDGIRRYQTRHGLDADGVIGSATQAAIAVPMTWRVRQIELALERLRWLPDFAGGRVIAVNIPMFRLWAWNRVAPDEPPALSMKVVVGRAITQTPVFADQLEHVIFRPYWNVPSSILRNEMMPAIARDPGYLSKQNLEIVRGPGDLSPVLPPTPAHIAELGRNGVRLRQRPGSTNALGRVKFMFPNSNDVYMHDTPATELFARSRRDFSHGCIRVENPAALAEWALSELPEWPRARVDAALEGAPNVRVDLPEPIQVVIFYTTAEVEPADGSTHFAADIYGHDAALDKVL